MRRPRLVAGTHTPRHSRPCSQLLRPRPGDRSEQLYQCSHQWHHVSEDIKTLCSVLTTLIRVTCFCLDSVRTFDTTIIACTSSRARSRPLYSPARHDSTGRSGARSSYGYIYIGGGRRQKHPHGYDIIYTTGIQRSHFEQQHCRFRQQQHP